MTLEELEHLCESAETNKIAIADPGFVVCVPGGKRGETVTIAPGLRGKNLGHYPGGTRVFLRTRTVRAFIQKVRESL